MTSWNSQMKHRRLAVLAGLSSIALVQSSGLLAQGTADTRAAAAADRAGEEIVVTARRREEHAIDVPASITALSSHELERYGTHDFQALQKQVPGLVFQPQASSAGGTIALRGISSAATNPATDHAVAINIDGVQVGSGAVMRLGIIDLQQIEVLKGPQALFFGKNSPAGVVSMQSADPGDHFELKGSVETEFNAREFNGQIAGGGPITDTLGVRAVVYGSHMRGWLYNTAVAVPGFSYAPPTSRGPQRDEFFFRGTAVFKPVDNLSIRAKYNFDNVTGDTDPFSSVQRFYCPRGAPQMLGYPATQDCMADARVTNGGLDPRDVALLAAKLPAGTPFYSQGSKTRLHLASATVNWEPVPDIKLTSVTGYFRIYDLISGPSLYQSGGGLVTNLISTRREISQEVRLATSKADWPINFTIGGYYQDTRIHNNITNAIDKFAQGTAPAPGVSATFANEDFTVEGRAYSVFGQAIWKPIPQVEIAGGARWSHETKSVSASNFGAPVTYGISRLTFNNVSPEVTARYEPMRGLAIYVGWRNGFKSGGFNTASGATAASRIDYRPEKIRGFEGGVKIDMGSVRANLAAYSYNYKDLQVAAFDPVTISQRLINAAKAKLQGVEGDISWRTPLDGLELHGSFNYNHARYKEFLAGCYTGQTIAEGCNQVLNANNGRFTSQDLAGRQLAQAPDFTATAGFAYLTPVGENLQFGMTGDMLYYSGYFAQVEQAPAGRQNRYATLDGSISLGAANSRWKLALIGRNLTEVWRTRNVSQGPLTGISSRTGTAITGGQSDLTGNFGRGREIRLQFSFRY